LPEARFLNGLLHFGRFLRQRGLPVTPSRLMDLTRAMPECDLSSYHDLFLAGRVILVDRREDLPIYDEAFLDFWRPQAADGAPEAAPHALPHVASSAPQDSDAPFDRAPLFFFLDDELEFSTFWSAYALDVFGSASGWAVPQT